MRQRQSLLAFNSLALAAEAEFFATPDSIDSLTKELDEARQYGLAVTVIGEGTNLVVTGDVAGLVLKPELAGKRILADDGETCLVMVAAGEHFDDLVSWSLAKGLQGLENLSLIPGSAGAAPFQNIGAYGVELSDRLEWVEAINIATGQMRRFSQHACGFGYRDSFFKSQAPNEWLITRLCLRLYKQAAKQPLMLAYADLAARLAALPDGLQGAAGVRSLVCALRRQKLPNPAELANVGSFFKNPLVPLDKARGLVERYPDMPFYTQASGDVKLAAGWLIEQAGFKGKRCGAVGMHERQSLVLVNYGGASVAEVQALATRVRAAVAARFDVTLEQEPVNLPRG